MKTLVKTIALALTALTLSFSTVSATGLGNVINPSSYKVGMYVSQKAMVLNVMVEKQAGKQVLITLKDATGQTLASQTISRNEERSWSRFNLSQLSDGAYRVEITNGDETTSKDITVSSAKPVQMVRTLEVK